MSKLNNVFSKDRTLYTSAILETIEAGEKRRLNKKGPCLVWMQENENDTILREPDPQFLTGIPTLSASLNDFFGGLAMVFGQPNAGKSSFIVQCINDLCKNDKVSVVDFTLDDSIDKRMVQLICNETGLSYSKVSSLKSLTGSERLKYDSAKEKIVERIELGAYLPIPAQLVYPKSLQKNNDARILTWNNTGILTIEEILRVLKEQDPKRQIVAFIDSFHDIDMDSHELAIAKKQVEKFKQSMDVLEIKVMMSAHVRKINDRSNNIRLEDVWGGKFLEYILSWGTSIRNDKKEHPNDNFLIEVGGKNYPILWFYVEKSKVSSWGDYVLIYAFDKDSCRLIPLNKDEYLKALAYVTGKK